MLSIKQNIKNHFGGLLFIVLVASVSMFSSSDVLAKTLQTSRIKHPQATLNAQARTEVAQDTIRINLAVEVSGDSQQNVSNELSKSINQSMATARENADGITVTSGSYHIWPMNDQDGRISNWRGRGELFLESKNFEVASELAAQLGSMSITSLRFFVSPQKAAEHEEALLTEAVQAFQKRAQALAQALGFSRYAIRSVDLSGAGISFESSPVMMRSAAFNAADAIPVEGGTETISVTVQGTVYLFDE